MGDLGLLRFEEAYMERVWGGTRLRSVFGKPAPDGVPVGEAWLVGDHPVHESIVAEGPFAGRTLRDLMERDAAALLGARARATMHGRFPLLLKILDANDLLSVQVHPDDEAAARLGERDSGKTEMWHVLDAEPGSELYCGLDPAVTGDSFARAIKDLSVPSLLRRFPAYQGDSVFVPAGTVHAIGGGLLIAEIQQNSDLTYRVYDWGRLGSDGVPRALHIDKAVAVTRFGVEHGGAARTLSYEHEGGHTEVLGACQYFAGVLHRVSGSFTRCNGGATFHILLARDGHFVVRAGDCEKTLQPGEALVSPGSLDRLNIAGQGLLLDYFVPDLRADIITPLRAAGHRDEAIAGLGGAAVRNDVARSL